MLEITSTPSSRERSNVGALAIPNFSTSSLCVVASTVLYLIPF